MSESRFFATTPALFSVASLAATVMLTLCAGSAHAQATMFTNRTTFLAAVSSGATNINFDTVATGDLTDFSTPAGLTISGVKFTGNLAAGGNMLEVLRPTYYATYQGWNGNPTVLAGPSGSGNPPYAGTFTITLPAGITAVGTDLYTVAQGDTSANTVSPVLFTLSNGQTFTSTTFAKPTLAFFGVTSTAPITSITVQAPAGAVTFPDLSNFVFGHAAGGTAAAPEPGSIALLGTSLLPLAGLIARRRRTATVAALAVK